VFHFLFVIRLSSFCLTRSWRILVMSDVKAAWFHGFRVIAAHYSCLLLGFSITIEITLVVSYSCYAQASFP
jgi:hypothetical protein